MKILCIGEALIDMICTDHGISLDKGVNFTAKPGGAPANVAAVIAALGGQAGLAARVGKDAFGKKLIGVLAAFGVDTRWIMESPEEFTTMAFVSLMENGERDFIFNRGADGRLSREDTERIGLEDVSIVHFGSATAFLPGPLHEACLGLLQRAREQGKFISFDPNYREMLCKDRLPEFMGQCHAFLPYTRFFKMSEEEAMLISGESSVETAVALLQQQYKAVFAITLGKQGALLRVGAQILNVPGIPVDAIDTTGAGDAFVGAVLYQLSRLTRDAIDGLGVSAWTGIIANANKAGAITCRHFGAMEAFAHLKGEMLF